MIKRDKNKTLEEQVYDLRDYGYSPDYVAKCLGGIEPVTIASIWLGRHKVDRSDTACKKMLMQGDTVKDICSKLNLTDFHVARVFNQLSPIERETAEFYRAKLKREKELKILLYLESHTKKETASRFGICVDTVTKIENNHKFSQSKGIKDGFTQIG